MHVGYQTFRCALYTSTQNVEYRTTNQTLQFWREADASEWFESWNMDVKCGQYVVRLWNITNIGSVIRGNTVVRPCGVQ